ncbi:MAG: DUF6603 domain-containing protein [Bacteroidota bacterium]
MANSISSLHTSITASWPSVTLSAKLLGSNYISLFQQYFSDSDFQIHLTGTGKVQFDAANNKISFAGTVSKQAGGAFAGMTLNKVVLQEVAGDIQFNVVATPGPDYLLTDSFKGLNSAILKHISFTDATMSFASFDGTIDGAEVEKGFYFTGTMELPSLIAGFVEEPQVWGKIDMVGGTKTNGTKTLVSYAPSMMLATNINVGEPKGFGSVFEVEFLSAQLWAVPYFNSFDGRWKSNSYLKLNGSYEILSEQANIQIKIPGPTGNYVFTTSFLGEVTTGMSELSKAFKTKSSLGVPQFKLKSPKGLSVKDIKMIYNVGGGKGKSGMRFIQLELGTAPGEKWKLFNNGYIEDIDIDFRFLPTDKEIDADISGKVEMGENGGGISLAASASNKGPISFTGGLADGHPLELKDALTFFAGNHFHNLPNLTINKLTIGALLPPAPNRKDYIISTAFRIYGFWEIINHPVSLGLREVGFDFNRSKDGIQLKANAMFDISVYQISVEADYDTGHGWNFTGDVSIDPKANPMTFSDLITDIDKQFHITNDVALPSAIGGIYLSALHTTFNTHTKDFTFTCVLKDTDFPGMSFEVDVDYKQVKEGHERTFKGILKISDDNFQMEFDLIFQSDADSKIFLAAYENTAGGEISIGDLYHAMTGDTAPSALDDVTFKIKNALLVYDRDVNTKSNLLLGLNVDAGVDLGHLPLVGKIFPGASSMKIELQPMIVKGIFTETDYAGAKGLVPDGGFELPEFDSLPTTNSTSVSASFSLFLGERQIKLDKIDFSSIKDQTGSTADRPRIGNAETPAPKPPAASSSNIKWINIQKKLGPFQLNKIGINYDKKSKEAFVLLDAGLSIAGLNVELDGLYAASKLSPIDPSFGLHGLSLKYEKGPLQIGGGFLRSTQTLDGYTYTSYDGFATISAEILSIGAVGSYAYFKGHPSLFIYAALDYPIGGPEFFFVTGIAGGFGYNRKVIMPPIDQVKSFPFVSEALGGAVAASDPSKAPTDELAKLHKYIQPAYGEYWFAAGIHFTSFDLLDVFILAIVSFGDYFKLDLLGIGTLALPAPEEGDPVPPIAEVQLEVKATFDPHEGILLVRANLTKDSYILDPKCRLTGGFAFYTWFKDQSNGAQAGDFVLTFGGYHPAYKPASYYPRVAPVGFNWHVIDPLVFKGNAYFALVPNAVMAGANLSATFKIPLIKAYFDAGLDMLISWKPVHYDFYVGAEIGVLFTYWLFGIHHIDIGLGAKIHIFGPKFSAHVEIKYWIIHFTIHVGADGKQPPAPLTWGQFRKAFLPADNNQILKMSLKSGMVKEEDDDGSGNPAGYHPNSSKYWIINPKDFAFQTHSSVPLTAANYVSKSSGNITIPMEVGATKATTHFGLGSMGLSAGQADAQVVHNITVEYYSNEDKKFDPLVKSEYEKRFTITPVLSQAPTAIWGNNLLPEMNGAKFIPNACFGINLKAQPPVKQMHTCDVERAALLFDSLNFPKSYAWNDFQTFTPTSGQTEQERRTYLEENIESNSSSLSGVLAALGIQDSAYLHTSLAEDFVLAPQIAS